MIPLKTVFVISAIISVLIFTPSYSFAQSNQNDSPLAGLFEFFSQLFGQSTQSEPVIEFEDAVVIQSSNSTPTADAGDDQTVMEFAKVTLDGSSSTDPDGDPITYKWTQTTGPEVFTGSMTTVESPMFMAPEGDQTLTFELFVVDTSSATSEVDEVIITVTDKDGNSPPTAEPPGNDNGKEKVTICHAPPGNPNNAHTITVGTYAAQAHLIHHEDDLLGSCEGENSGRGNSGVDNSGKGNSNNVKDNDNKSNSGKGNNNDDDDDRKGNSGKGNQNIKDENDNKSNSGKGNNNDDDDDRKGNSGKGNSNNNNENLKIKSNENEDEDEDEDD